MAVLITAALILLIGISLGYLQRDNDYIIIEEALVTTGDQVVSESLPVTVSDLSARSEVTVSFTLDSGTDRQLFFGSVYAPLVIYADDQPIYEYGQDGTYPSFMKDPPTQYASVLLPQSSEPLTIRMVYHSPKERNNLSIHSMVVGSHEAILDYLLDHSGLNFALSMVFVSFGILLAFISLTMIRVKGISQAVLFPGLFALFAGMWQLGENTLSVYLFQNPTLLYFIDFMGLFLLMIPLYSTALFFLNKKGSPFLEIILLVNELATLIAIVLQLTGVVSFHRILFVFHAILPLSLVLLVAYTIYEAVAHRSDRARLFLIPFLVLSASAVLELANYYLHFMNLYSVIFQFGVFLFAIIMTVLSAFYIKGLLADQRRKDQLEGEVRIRDQILSYQKSRLESLLSMSDEIRHQRHDLRHHLRTIDDLIQKGLYGETRDYIRTVTNAIPTYSVTEWCKNPVVNSTISYYSQCAEQENIQCEIHVEVPDFNHNISDSNLCVIFGNLLENAIEACRRMNSESRYIKLCTILNGEMLYITMDNSYNGVVHKDGQEYLSSKRSGTGTGLQSVRSLAESHGGSAEFTPMENCFRTEVCVRI